MTFKKLKRQLLSAKMRILIKENKTSCHFIPFSLCCLDEQIVYFTEDIFKAGSNSTKCLMQDRAPNITKIQQLFKTQRQIIDACSYREHIVDDLY